MSRWFGLQCKHRIDKEVTIDGDTIYKHLYDFGVMSFEDAKRNFSGFSFDTRYSIEKIQKGKTDTISFLGGNRDTMYFKAVREDGGVRVIMRKNHVVSNK